ncbi:o-acetyltransferase CAS1 [Fusarium heterosporum]|uniref:O-acetyltransferase CAS1 n=1 Tax=Fusarium heterosporum TaxID=42747 RepID=A0A8H5TS34_FUSHE|nr:o-acetyltransferase CAS1 [Fusarium heterosporum]
MMAQSPQLLALAARFLPVFFSFLLLSAFAVDHIYTSDDPYRCKALLGESERNGSWLHAPDETGARKPFTNWQPDGCMLHHYTTEDIQQCMGDRHMVFSGDSTTRQVFWGMARLLDRKSAMKERKDAPRHKSYNKTFADVNMLHMWNPYYTTYKNRRFKNQLTLLNDGKHQKNKHKEAEIKEKGNPGLIMLGAGSWYAAGFFANESKTQFESAFDNITEILRFGDLPKFGTAPMDPVEGVGNEVFMAPVAPPYYNELPSSRTTPKGIHKGEIEAIDKFLYSQEDKHGLRLLRAFPQLSLNQPEAIVDRTITGLHVIDSVAEIKANILLNLRCNAKLDRISGYPFTRTCCTDYGGKPWIQHMIVGVVTIYAALCIIFEGISIVSSTEFKWFNIKIGAFAIALLYCYAADRTQLFAKGMKEFIPSEFYLLIMICGIIGALTFQKTKFRAPRLPGAEAAAKVEDAGILARDQTEEWKGWMQAAILVYHWTGASKNLPIYIFIRLLVASYLFQTGYGHTIYFLAKKDFSFRRVASVLLRLNILSCALPYVMGTDYMFYYFAPLVSFWFLIVYATLAICSGFNDSIRFVASKIGASFAFITLILNFTPVLGWIFAILDVIFRIKWDLKEWTFRVTLDGAIVFVGMLAGVVHQRVERNSAWYTNYQVVAIPSAAAIAGFGYFCFYLQSKNLYVLMHPLISIVPVVAFIGIRNATTPMRNFYSTAAAWLGRCSLETFILQFHIFLAADTRGVLLVDAFKGDGSLINDRWRDLAVIVPIFLWISHLVAEASGTIVKLILGAPPPKPADSGNDEEEGNELKIVEPLWESMPMLNNRHLDRAINLCKCFTTGLHMRIVLILGTMWLLNWLW